MRMSKKIITTCFFVMMLFVNVTFVLANAVDNETDSQIPLEQQLIGTWRWEVMDSWILVFREDGTMIDGVPGFRTEYSWEVVDDRLMVDGIDWNLRWDVRTEWPPLAIVVDRYGRDTYTYVWHSSSTEAETSMWLFWLFISFVVGLIVLVVWLIKRRKKRKESQQIEQIEQEERGFYNQEWK